MKNKAIIKTKQKPYIMGIGAVFCMVKKSQNSI